MKRDEQGGGTNADGTRSGMYCSRCFREGRFTAPDCTVGQMQELVKGKLKEFGFPGFLAAWFTRGVPRLERWKSRTADEGGKKAGTTRFPSDSIFTRGKNPGYPRIFQKPFDARFRISGCRDRPL